jgi:hypothetical protein
MAPTAAEGTERRIHFGASGGRGSAYARGGVLSSYVIPPDSR